MPDSKYPHTPDGRYFVAKSRLWRCSDPSLDRNTRQIWVKRLMDARRAIGQNKTTSGTQVARDKVQEAKVALGERGPVWWDDGTVDVGGKHPKNTPYADWWYSLSDAERSAGTG